MSVLQALASSQFISVWEQPAIHFPYKFQLATVHLHPSLKPSHPSSSEVSWPAAENRPFLYECIIGHWWTNRHSLSLPDLGKKILNILPDVHVGQHNPHIIYNVLNIKNNGFFQLVFWQMMIAVHFIWEASKTSLSKYANRKLWALAPDPPWKRLPLYSVTVKLCMHLLDGIQLHSSFPPPFFL